MSDQTLEIVKLAMQAIVAVAAVVAGAIAWQTKRAVQKVDIHLDGRLTQLLEQTGAASRAEGRDSMRAGDGRDSGGVGPAGPAGIQGPVGPQGQVGPQGKQGD